MPVIENIPAITYSRGTFIVIRCKHLLKKSSANALSGWSTVSSCKARKQSACWQRSAGDEEREETDLPETRSPPRFVGPVHDRSKHKYYMGDHKSTKSLTSSFDCICIFRDTNVFQYVNKETNKQTNKPGLCPVQFPRRVSQGTGWATLRLSHRPVLFVTLSSDLDLPTVCCLLFARPHVRLVTTVACCRHNRICCVQFASHTANDQNETFLNLSLHTTLIGKPRHLLDVSGQLRSPAALPRYLLNNGLGGSQSRSGRFLFLPGFQPQIGQSGVRIPVRY